ncbi:MAG: hypothetical protein OEY79_03595 [Anaplasmataceae bacterium]|nr:hypothetical protein [Anaplasmataceae bacterium]
MISINPVDLLKQNNLSKKMFVVILTTIGAIVSIGIILGILQIIVQIKSLHHKEKVLEQESKLNTTVVFVVDHNTPLSKLKALFGVCKANGREDITVTSVCKANGGEDITVTV